MTSDQKASIAVVTPSFARDYDLCRGLNSSVLTHTPYKHYLFVDRSDLELFRQLANARTVVMAIEEMIPRAFFKVSFLKRHWMSTVSLPVKGWLVQQIVKISAASVVDELTILNMDSDTLFIRDVRNDIFRRDDRTRLYRLPNGVRDGMSHVRMHRNVARLLNVAPSTIPTDDYVGNMITWDRETVLAMCRHIEAVTGRPWYVGFARGRMVSEYTAYGLFVDKVLGTPNEITFHDRRSHCLTYWGPEPLLESKIERFVDDLMIDDVACSIEGYTKTENRIVEAAIDLIKQKVVQTRDVNATVEC